MPIIHLTKRTIQSLDYPERGQVLFRDGRLRGFGLRVGTRSKVYFAEGQAGRRTRHVTIGRADVISPNVARQRAMVLLAEMATGKNPNQEKQQDGLTMAQAFDAFFKVRDSLAPNTVDHYRRARDLYLADWRKKPIAEITRQMVLARHQRLGRQHGEATANNAMRQLRSVYNFTAADHDEHPPNPVTILTQARAWYPERRRRGVVAAHDMPAWWSVVMQETPDARDVLLVALLTGMRRSEVLTLRWENVDLVACVITVPRTKNGYPLELPLSGFLADLIAARREIVGQTLWVFPGVGRRGHLAEVKSFVRRVAEASGVAFSMHDLRRTFITVAESLDIPHYALKQLPNHRADSDVTGRYIVINAERLRDPVERIAARILELADDEREEREQLRQ